MSDTKKTFSVDWLMRGALTKFGDIFDRITGRSWKPSSSLATSELIEKLNKLLDREAKDLGKKGIFVPHNLKLKIQWDKFSADSETAMQKLEHELLTAVIDHINDRRYHTYAPLQLHIKPDYFTEGVRLLAGFDKFAGEENEAAVSVTVPNLKNIVIPASPEVKIEKEKEIVTAEFTIQNKLKKTELFLSEGERVSVGRTKENALCIEDGSISKVHATLLINSEKQLMVADTGSTNGTFINGKRIAYGKALHIANGDKIRFGTIEVALDYTPPEIPAEIAPEPVSSTINEPATEKFNSADVLPEKIENTRVIENAKPLAETSLAQRDAAENNLPETAIKRPAIDLNQVKAKAPAENYAQKPALNKTAEANEERSSANKPEAEKEANLTGQGIVFDFGEDK